MKRLVLLGLVALLALAGLAQAQAAKPPGQKAPGQAKKVTICHRTASATNPYRKIRVARAGLKGHRRHPGDIIPAPAGGCPKTPMSPTQGGTALTATLTGAAEVPGPGDADGTGQATIRVRRGEGRLCYDLRVGGITLPASAAHIHEGAAGVAGDIVVALGAPDATGAAAGCVNVSRALTERIFLNPAGYYVNVHTSDFPNGAVRGQLS